MSKIIVLLPFAVAFTIVFVLGWVLRRNKQTASKQYDERQLLIQGKAYKYAFFTLVSYLVIIGMLTMIWEIDFATTYVYTLIGICVGLIVYVTYSLFHDAYIGMDKSKNLSAGVAFFVGACNAGPVILFELDQLYADGILQPEFGRLIIGLTAVYIGIILVVKKKMDEKE